MQSITSLGELRKFASNLVDQTHSKTIGLSGELGSGKTTLVRFIAEELAKREKRPLPRVTSPSFVIHQFYDLGNYRIEHFDLYRLERVMPETLASLGYEECVERIRKQKGFVFVEWPEKVTDLAILELDLKISITLDGNIRRVEVRSTYDGTPQIEMTL